MRSITILLSILILASCQDKKTKLFNEIKAMEQSEKLGTPEGLNELALLHEEYGLNYSDSLGNSYLYAAGMHYYFNDEPLKTKSLLNAFIQRGDSGLRQRNAYMALAQIAFDAQAYDSVDYFTDIVLAEHKLTNKQWSDLSLMYQKKIKDQGEAEITDYEKLSKAYWALGSFPQALAMLDSAIGQFPEEPLQEKLIYQAGFVAWEYLEDAELAKKYYRMYLALYPEGEYAVEVETILQSGMLEMTDEAILEMLKSGS